MKCTDSSDIVGVLFLDFRKAFDFVDHTILMKKTFHRQKVIESDKGLTEFFLVRSDVPQGFILGPTLFLILINDMPLCFDHCKSDTYIYADDATVHVTGKNISNIEHSLLCYVWE